MINEKFLSDLIKLQTVCGNLEENKKAISLLKQYLESLGFGVVIEGSEETAQPVIVAHRPATDSHQKIVIYGHYDVAPVSVDEAWKINDPFNLEILNSRIYGRGIADNKGPLSARLSAVANNIELNEPCPEILWLIQGEEEVEKPNPVASRIFSHYIEKFASSVYVEETGFNDLEAGRQLAFLWSKGRSEENLISYHSFLNECLDNPIIEFRHLNKLTGVTSCPLLSNLPENVIYIGFGPNDKHHNIHRVNESLDVNKLRLHAEQFSFFLKQYAQLGLNGVREN